MWLRSAPWAKEKKVYSMIEVYIATVIEVVLSFEEMSRSIREDEHHRLRDLYMKINMEEKEADAIRRTIADEICKGTFFAHLREDILNLIEKIDDIGDWVKSAARIIVDMHPSRELLDCLFKSEEMEEYVRALVAITKKLEEAIRRLRGSGMGITSLLHEVEDIEERSDDLKMTLIKKIIDKSDDYRIVDIIEMRDMIYLIDNATDSAEDASDILLLILAKGYS